MSKRFESKRLETKRLNQSWKRIFATVDTLNDKVIDLTHNVYICVSDLRYKHRAAVDKVSLDGQKPTFSQEQMDKLIINDHPESGPVTKSFDGHYYVCKTCKQIIKNGKTPSCNEKEFKFLVPKLPADLIAKHGHLNRLEAHTLKRVIPFMRTAHIPRSNELKVMGPLINVEAEIEETMENFVPIDQKFIPCALKRKPKYPGAYIEEVIDKEKVLAYFQYFKENNHLYSDIDFNHETFEQFVLESLKRVEQQANWKEKQPELDESEDDSECDGEPNESQNNQDCSMDYNDAIRTCGIEIVDANIVLNEKIHDDTQCQDNLSGVSHVEFQLQDLNQHNDAKHNMVDDKNDQQQEHAESEDDTDDDNVELPDLNQEKDNEKPC